MKYIRGNDRNQIALIPTSLDAAIDADNEVRIIDLFVDSLDLSKMNFRLDFTENGPPAYHPCDLLKLFLYGYLNKVRSSRALEKECKRNLEVMWLLKSLTPDHNTIANFRKDNKAAIREVFKSTVQIAKHFHLIGGKLVAGDSTKIRAQNSKKNNFNKKKIERHLEYIENNLSKYNEELAHADGDKKKEIQDKIDKYNNRKDDYQNLDRELDTTGEKQISTSDPDSRNIMIRNHISEVSYCVQTTVDAKNNIPVDYKLSNQNDSKAMGYMLKRAVNIIGHNNFTALYDKGYHTGSELKTAQDLGVKTIVAIPQANTNRSPDPSYNSSEFLYNDKEDTYSCPKNQILKSSGTWYKVKSGANVKHYRTKACKDCNVRALCTAAKSGGRLISRSEFYEQYKINQQLVDLNPLLYKKRQAIVEHPYGTIKRQWGFDHIITKKGMDRAAADVGFIFTAYNLRRLFNILPVNQLKKYLIERPLFLTPYIVQINVNLASLKALFFKPNYTLLKINIA